MLPPLCDIPLGGCFFTEPWTVTWFSLRVLCRVAALCRPLRPVLLLVSFLRSRSPVVGVPGLCWLRRMPVVRWRCPIVGIPRLHWLLRGSFDSFCFPRTSAALQSSTTCLNVFLCACPPLPPLCDIPSGCCFFTGPWTVTRSSLRMLHQVAAFCRPLQPVLLLGSFPRSRSPVVGVPGLCWMWRGVPFAR